MEDPGIVRNRLKVASSVRNAKAFLAVQKEYGSFAEYLWAWVDGKPIVNRPRTMADLPTHTELSDRVSKDLKKRGFNFVGTTIIYSYLEAVGVINDHLVTCPKAPRTLTTPRDLSSGSRSSTWGWRPVRIGLSGASTSSVRCTSAPIVVSRARHAASCGAVPRLFEARPRFPRRDRPDHDRLGVVGHRDAERADAPQLERLERGHARRRPARRGTRARVPTGTRHELVRVDGAAAHPRR